MPCAWVIAAARSHPVTPPMRWTSGITEDSQHYDRWGRDIPRATASFRAIGGYFFTSTGMPGIFTLRA
jgi:hypothetical protein